MGGLGTDTWSRCRIMASARTICCACRVKIGLLRSGRHGPGVRARQGFRERTGEPCKNKLSEKRDKKTNAPRVQEAHGRSYTTSSSIHFRPWRAGDAYVLGP